MAQKNSTPQNDSVELLYQKFLAVLAKIDGIKNKKDWMDGIAKAAIDNGDREGMLRIFRYSLKIQREQADLAAKRERYELAIAPVREAWSAALNAWTQWVEAEVAKNPKHQAQLVMSRAYWQRYFAAETRINSLWEDGPDAIPGVITDLEALASDVANHYQDNWCANCGAPTVSLITPKNGGKAFRPRLCTDCNRARPEAITNDLVASKSEASGAREKRDRHARVRRENKAKASQPR